VMQLIAEGRAVEIFANGDVPDPHETWVEGDLADWMVPIVERFHDTVGDEQQTLVLERANDADDFDDRCIQKVAELLATGALRRDRAVRWHIIGADTGQELSLAVPFHGEERVGRETVAAWIDVTWDGLRSLPYDDDELAIALGRSIAALAWPALAVDINSPLLDELLPGKLPIDLVSETRGDPLAFVSGSSLRATLRPDLASLLAPAWRHLADQIHLLLMVVGHPAVLFRLDRWRRLFASEIIPAQIYWAATGESEWVIYDFTQIVQIREH
jgi:hypothetical protein